MNIERICPFHNCTASHILNKITIAHKPKMKWIIFLKNYISLRLSIQNCHQRCGVGIILIENTQSIRHYITASVIYISPESVLFYQLQNTDSTALPLTFDLTHHIIVANIIPTKIQSMKTTQRRSLKIFSQASFMTNPKPMEVTEYKIKRITNTWTL